MLRARVIPVLLVSAGRLIKTVNFKEEIYIGDPLNAVKIFNDKCADELVVFDISCSTPDFELISRISRQCRMPLCYGGGVTSVADFDRLISLGVEKVSVSRLALDMELVSTARDRFGAQSVVCTADVRWNAANSEYSVYVNRGKDYLCSLGDFIKSCRNLEVGEVVINSIDRDGTRSGYDLNLIRLVSESISCQATFVGGCDGISDMRAVLDNFGLVGVAAGSFFVLRGKFRAVLISYPSIQDRVGLINTVAKFDHE